MDNLFRKYHPATFDMGEIEPINTAFIQYTYVEGDKFERVEAEKYINENDSNVTYFKNGERISEFDFYEKAKERFLVEKNRVVFLHDYNICFLDIYIKPNYQIIPVITIEFATEEEKQAYRPLKWFGQEVNDKFYNEHTLWHTLQSVS